MVDVNMNDVSLDDDAIEVPKKRKIGRPRGQTAKQEAASAKESSLGESKADLEYMGSRDEAADARTIESRRRIRNKVKEDIEAFITAGGAIDQVAANVTADPPKKPSSNYGGRAI
ncbi:hypothetical protein EDC56_2454 [Sinobacterium caligoides]|uniref:Transcriptional regulator SutA RNAP-binding domain-containing protein n=1 Tax=Sinobacterium caligoides TaxID=933926 RepID=A0A3N2DRS0_9GAMM|nr:hypothetical protein [Sinobacterium caligoides]ROS02005.1 hypothetical protein EDC56_2454 [Sinobacterium caligoides]